MCVCGVCGSEFCRCLVVGPMAPSAARPLPTAALFQMRCPPCRHLSPICQLALGLRGPSGKWGSDGPPKPHCFWGGWVLTPTSISDAAALRGDGQSPFGKAASAGPRLSQPSKLPDICYQRVPEDLSCLALKGTPDSSRHVCRGIYACVEVKTQARHPE